MPSMMNRRIILWSGAGAVGLAGALFGAWLLTLPPATSAADPPPLGADEADDILSGLKAPKRERPLVAVIGINDATETTDYLMPYGILRRSDVADAMLLATRPGPVTLFPALTVEPHATVAEFDERHPDGADYVLVPAMSRDDDPAVLAWLRQQASKGATIIGVCAGAKVVGEAGLLDGKRATTHWYYVKELRKDNPSIRYVPDRRVVVDGGVATTTGITASIPIALTVIEAIAGRARAETVAREVGLENWDARHRSDAFQFTRPFALTALVNAAAFWRREQFGIELTPGLDEVSLALVADAWSRTFRSRAVTFASAAGTIESRNSIRIVPDRVAASWPAENRLPAIGSRPPARALDEALDAIQERYGARTAYLVAMQLEYPRQREDGHLIRTPVDEAG
jgi:transcriptional regulator GlxA family with amidase domain